MGPVVVVSTVTLAASPPDVWPLITDTDRANRLVMGRGNVYRPIEIGDKGSARFIVETRIAGMAMSYEEAPFEWTANERFSVLRRMRSGPLASYTFGMSLEPAGEGTRLTIRLELVPRLWILRPIAFFQGRRVVAGMLELAEQIDAHLEKDAPSPFAKPVTPANEERLGYAQRELSKRLLEPAVITTLLELIRNASDADLVRIRPFELAALHGHDGTEMLRVLLHATTIGTVELRWALVCPSCRTANDQVTSLAEIGTESHCQLCDISFGIELDRAVEATFVPHPSVREVTNQMFCIGGPFRTPHVIVQAVLPAGATRELMAPTEPGRYRLFARGGSVVPLEVADDAPVEAEARLLANGTLAAKAELRIAPRGRLRVSSALGEDRHVKIERLGYASLAATAQIVTMMSEFRRFFSKDLLKAGTPLKVASCAILFSDLTGSTALYTAAGDAAAFRLVDDHFDVLRAAIEANGGAVVKTMGDAIMAAFRDPLACVRASLACLLAFERFRVDAANGELTGIKLGLFDGPCYVVTANDAIDYFGQTVNCAARVQHCAESGELVFEEALWDRLTHAERADLRLVAHFETHVKGVAHPLRLVRTRLAEDVVSARRLPASDPA